VSFLPGPQNQNTVFFFTPFGIFDQNRRKLNGFSPPLFFPLRKTVLLIPFPSKLRDVSQFTSDPLPFLFQPHKSRLRLFETDYNPPPVKVCLTGSHAFFFSEYSFFPSYTSLIPQGRCFDDIFCQTPPFRQPLDRLLSPTPFSLLGPTYSWGIRKRKPPLNQDSIFQPIPKSPV